MLHDVQLLSEKGPLKIYELYILVTGQPAPSLAVPPGGRAGYRRRENMVLGVLTSNTRGSVPKGHGGGGMIFTQGRTMDTRVTGRHEGHR